MRASLFALACLVVGVFICFFALRTGQTATTVWLPTCAGCAYLCVCVCVSVLCFPEMERGKDLHHWRRAA